MPMQIRQPLSGWSRAGTVAAALLAGVALASAALAVSGEQQGDASNEALFREAEDIFNSARQPEAIPLLSRLLARLDLLDPPAALNADSRELLARCLYYRAIAQFNLGDEAAANEDLRRLIGAQPHFDIERGLVSPKFEELFDGLRASLLGTLQMYVAPEDVDIRIDGELLTDNLEPVLLVAGPHTVVVERPGYEPWLQEVEVAAGRVLDQQVTLERTSAVIQLLTRPPNATVIVDGREVGVTSGTAPRDAALGGDAARYPLREFSDILVIDGLRPGTHQLSLRLEGFRNTDVELTLSGLGDFDAGAFVLHPLQGTVALLGLPEGAVVTLDGVPAPLRRDAAGTEAGTWLIDAFPGDYQLTVVKPGGGIFEGPVTVLDRQTLTLDIDLRPSIAFVGVLGGDQVGATRLAEALHDSLGSAARWAFLDRSETAAATVARAALTAENLRDLAALAFPGDGAVDWSEVQRIFEADLVGSLYVLAVLSDDLLATEADLWIWPATPGPPVPDRVRVSLEDLSGMAPFVAGLERPFVGTRPWFGAVVVDSDAVQGPLVVDVSPGSPAAEAGLQPGDEIVYVGTDTATGASMVRQRLESTAAGSRSEIIVRRSGESVRTSVILGSSPEVIPGGLPSQSYAAVWAASLTSLGSADATIEPWVAELNVASVLMQAGLWDEAVRRLRAVRVPGGSGFAQAMVDYLLGNALEAIGPQYLESARDAYTRAAAVPEARLWHRDGPYLVPRARARLATLGGPSTNR